MNTSSSSLSTSSSSKRPKHDLFVNYLYEDIGDSFISHVHGALHRNGFTISNHTKVPVGQKVCSEVLKAIEESEICVLVFSINYASSVRCLNELAHIMDCRDKFDQKKVFPVFFKVDPRDVRKQKGPFKKAFKAHTAKFDHQTVQKWRKALNDAGHLSGQHYINGDEERFICKKIIKKLQSMQKPQQLYVTDHGVGIESRVDELLSLLRLDSEEDVSMIVAVLGIGGIGKTTIVKALYNRIAAEFDASCFLDVIPYDCRSLTLKFEMQKLLISSLSKNDKLPLITNGDQAIAMIRKLASSRKVLLVLDDVTHVDQLKAFGINPYDTRLLNTCFEGGSRIVVTTRDKRSLGRLSYVSYDTPLLDMEESMELLTRIMYEQDDHPIEDTEFLEEIARCAAGLPLVVEVWSLHFRHYERKQWPDVLKTLKAIPHDDVHKKLKISYDALDERAKKLFLDIACFFYNEDKELIVKVLQDEGSGFFPDHEIQCLADRGLVNIDDYWYTRVSMHKVIRETGEEIVRQENEDEPGQRTRLMKDDDVCRVLEECSGTQSVQSIRYQGYMTVDMEAFRKMKNLRLISLPFGVDLRCDSDEGMSPPPLISFPKLKYLHWHKFPMESINNIDMCNVVVVKLRYSSLKTLWEGSSSKPMKKLKILDVSHSEYLTKIGSFIGLKDLESLNFSGCKILEELDSSVCCLRKLVSLSLSGCYQLKRFPSERIGKLGSLEELDLSRCASIGFEDDEVIKAFMSSLKETHITQLTLNGCNVCKVPSEIGSLTRLKHLDLRNNKFHSLPDHSLIKLEQLETLRLSECCNLQSIPDLLRSVCSVKASDCDSLTTLPSNMSELTSLRELYLSNCICLTSLPPGMSGLTSLKRLDLSGCSKLGIEDPECLMKITGLTNLTYLNMKDCNVSQVPCEIGNLVSLKGLDLSRNTFSSLPDSFSNLLLLLYLPINNCSELTSLPLLPPFLERIEATGCLSLDVMRSASAVVEDEFYLCEFSKCVLAAYKETSFYSGLRIDLSADEVPKWCHYIGTRQGESFMAPQLHMKIFGMILCSRARHHEFELQNKTKGTSYCVRMDPVDCPMRVCFIPLDNTTLIVEAGDEFAIDFVTYCHRSFPEYGLCLIYKNKGDEMEMEMEMETHLVQSSEAHLVGNWVAKDIVVISSGRV